MIGHKSLEQKCRFETERLSIKSWKSCVTELSNEKDFAEDVINILTEPVTKSLPDGWQRINDTKKADDWIKRRAEESAFLAIQLLPSLDVVGFLFLYESKASDNSIELRLGYLLSESVWGKGLGSELIKGLVEWCEKQNNIKSISGGVEIENTGSIRVLEKNGFSIVQPKDSQENVVILERRFNQ
jgi:[ribosomal protein S5]-alanine N-acetyltransferase